MRNPPSLNPTSRAILTGSRWPAPPSPVVLWVHVFGIPCPVPHRRRVSRRVWRRVVVAWHYVVALAFFLVGVLAIQATGGYTR